MKSRLLTAIALLLFGTMAYAGFKGYDSSDVSLGEVHKMKCGTNMTCTVSGGKLTASVVAAAMTGDLSGDGGDQLFGFLQNQVASTTASLTAAQCGSTIISDSADVITLPEASTVLGCRYTFVCGTADDFDVNPADGTDQILALNSVAGGTGAGIAPSAGDAIRCTDAGASITLEATGANAWTAIGVGNLAWTDVN